LATLPEGGAWEYVSEEEGERIVGRGKGNADAHANAVSQKEKKKGNPSTKKREEDNLPSLSYNRKKRGGGTLDIAEKEKRKGDWFLR